MNRSLRAQIASETVEILESGRYQPPGSAEVDISSALQGCIEGTCLYEPDQLRSIHKEVILQPNPGHETAIKVVNETTLEGAFSISGQSAGSRSGVLNFGSAKNPGGGFLKGSQAQEESLTRSSGLYKSLLQCPGYYCRQEDGMQQKEHRRLRQGQYCGQPRQCGVGRPICNR